MEKVILELRASEGGEDSKLLVNEMRNIYIKTAKNNNIDWLITEERLGFVSIWLTGKNIKKIFNNEIGNHRWQRIPPYELVGLFGNSKSKQHKFLVKYVKSLNKFDNYKDFFIHEFEQFKNVSEEMMKKISKLYAMAKDDENISNVLTKINAKSTNESIKDWDLYHEIKTKQTIFKDLK